ncbi:MAG: hypothetical protein AB8B65_02415 [Kordia sp.]|uniref:hypothetical protein n=1 Tax=Kordia sp. TaxID=1965332 RepID=UPI00385A7339
MKNRSFLTCIIIFLITTLNCEKKQETLLNPQWDYENIHGFGKINIHEYTFCSIVPEVITQRSKVGLWTFYSPQKIKIAEGAFNGELNEINDHGGCSYSVYNISIDAKKWKFWDSNGKPIPTNKRDLDFIVSSDFDKK